MAKLQRYETYDGWDGAMCPNDDGEWVRITDIAELIKAMEKPSAGSISGGYNRAIDEVVALLTRR